jgi:hypothetical protein
MEWTDRYQDRWLLGWMSVTRHWLDECDATIDVRATARLMRGFFVADPEELSLLPYVEQFAGEEKHVKHRPRTNYGDNLVNPGPLPAPAHGS